ncbi:hypothetical protein [Marinobacter lutaoensis]|uniref:hypothetical protein n=1 Tax=Marinobacter lutaoensis TaxID=135739 RepID=UPI0011155D06|nr:hypothetical protein [Marinobacter lutaoensis]
MQIALAIAKAEMPATLNLRDDGHFTDSQRSRAMATQDSLPVTLYQPIYQTPTDEPSSRFEQCDGVFGRAFYFTKDRNAAASAPGVHGILRSIIRCSDSATLDMHQDIQFQHTNAAQAVREACEWLQLDAPIPREPIIQWHQRSRDYLASRVKQGHFATPDLNQHLGLLGIDLLRGPVPATTSGHYNFRLVWAFTSTDRVQSVELELIH